MPDMPDNRGVHGSVSYNKHIFAFFYQGICDLIQEIARPFEQFFKALGATFGLISCRIKE